MKSNMKLIILIFTLIASSILSAKVNQLAWHKSWDQTNDVHEIGFLPVTNLATGDEKLSGTPITVVGSPFDVLIKRNVDQSKNIIRQIVTQADGASNTRFAGFIPEVDGKLLMDLAYVMYDASYNTTNCAFTAKIKFFREDEEASEFYDDIAAGQFKRLKLRREETPQDQENATFADPQVDPAFWKPTKLIEILTTDDWACQSP